MRRVQLFVSCMVDLFRPETAVAAVSVLERRGVSVAFAPDQTCCGQFAYNAGHWADALAMASTLVHALATLPCDGIVGLSGSCVAMVREEYPKLFAWAAETGRAAPDADAQAAVSERLVEFSQWLAAEAWEPASGPPGPPLALHVGCHMRRLLGAVEEPQTVLERLGCPLVDYPDAEQCCGFGGTYAMAEPQISTAMADAKLAQLDAARQGGAQALAGADWGCLLHLAGRLARRGEDFPVLHLAELVDLADRGRLAPEHLRRAGAMRRGQA